VGSEERLLTFSHRSPLAACVCKQCWPFCASSDGESQPLWHGQRRVHAATRVFLGASFGSNACCAFCTECYGTANCCEFLHDKFEHVHQSWVLHGVSVAGVRRGFLGLSMFWYRRCSDAQLEKSKRAPRREFFTSEFWWTVSTSFSALFCGEFG
jgi:hypothetical protein